MSDSSDDGANLPPAAECDRRSKEFASITATDSALAMFYLQDVDWNLERALNAYFKDNASAVRAETRPSSSDSSWTTISDTTGPSDRSASRSSSSDLSGSSRGPSTSQSRSSSLSASFDSLVSSSLTSSGSLTSSTGSDRSAGGKRRAGGDVFEIIMEEERGRGGPPANDGKGEPEAKTSCVAKRQKTESATPAVASGATPLADGSSNQTTPPALNKLEEGTSSRILPQSDREGGMGGLQGGSGEGSGGSSRIRVMSWNIDGLDQNNIATRAKAVAQIILRERPDVVFLQELVSRNLAVLTADCPGYRLLVGTPTGCVRGEGDYVVGMMLRAESVVYARHDVTPFHGSTMARTLLCVEAAVRGVECLLMTSHLESTASHAAERRRQLSVAFERMLGADARLTVLFGGDLNLRDKELGASGRPPAGLLDLWEETGRRPEAEWTWDVRRNDNLDWSFGAKPRCRFDRLYRRAADRLLKPVYFELVGLERIGGACQRFPSDHWGILAHFDKV